MEWITILTKALFAGTAACGFAVLFNVPQRTLLHIFILGVLGTFLKNMFIGLEIHIILASFIGAATIGIVSLLAAKDKHAPPLVFAIPAVIPMVPGIFTYKFMLGTIRLIESHGPDFSNILSSTTNNGLKAAFILMGLAAGVGIPNLIFRRESFHSLTIKKK